MGYFSGDWDYPGYVNAVKNAIERGYDKVALDTEHCSYKSNELIKNWAKEDGHTVNIEMDTIIIFFNKNK